MSSTISDLRYAFYGTTQEEYDALLDAVGDGKDFAGLIAGEWGGTDPTAEIDAAIAAANAVTANRQTDSYTLVLGDASKAIEMNKATANDLTVPLNASVAFPVGTVIEIFQYGAGQTTVVATGGVTIRSSGGKLKLTGQYSAASLRKIAADEWALQGDIAA